MLICVNSIEAQSQSKKQSYFKSVKYKENVKMPLTVYEMAMLKEVYGDELDKRVLSNANKVKRIKHLLRNRIKIVEISNPRDQKDCVFLSEVPLLNNYNKKLKRDIVFNKEHFNPLKYNLNFFSDHKEIYRIDDTNFFIIINSQFN